MITNIISTIIVNELFYLQLEDELIGQKLKCKAINDELQQTFTEMSQLY